MNPLYIIVPVFNGERFIDKFISKFPDEFRSNLIFVNDGSTDDSSTKLEYYQVKVLYHQTNLGKGAAIQTALKWTKSIKHGKTVILDIDLQHPPEQLYEFLNVNESTISLGYRSIRNKMPHLRKFSNFLTSLLISVRSGIVIKDSQCGYRSFHSSLFEKINCHEKGFQYDSEMLIKGAMVNVKVEHIQIPTIYDDQQSAINNVNDTLRFIRMWLMSYFWT